MANDPEAWRRYSLAFTWTNDIQRPEDIVYVFLVIVLGCWYISSSTNAIPVGCFWAVVCFGCLYYGGLYIRRVRSRRRDAEILVEGRERRRRANEEIDRTDILDQSPQLIPAPPGPTVGRSKPQVVLAQTTFGVSKSRRDQSCSICLSDYTLEDTVNELICSHVFHVKCLRGWLESSAGSGCPICRHSLASKTVGVRI